MTREEAKILYTPKSTYNMKMRFVDKIYTDFEKQLEEAKAQGFREAVKEMDKMNLR